MPEVCTLLHRFRDAHNFAAANPGLDPAQLAELKVEFLSQSSQYPKLQDGYKRRSRVLAWTTVFAAMSAGSLKPVPDNFRYSEGLIRRNTEVDPVCHTCEHRMRSGGCHLDNKK